MTVCHSCGGADVDYDTSRGTAVCTGCGCVVEDQVIVSEVTFQETSTGGQVLGQFVPQEGGGKGLALGGGFHHGYGRDSREVTLSNGRRKIQTLIAQLHMTQHHVDAAHNWFKLAVQENFIQGRRTMQVIAACVYVVCRMEHTPHMLLDLSDALHINVYELGNTYLKLCHRLSIKPPTIDPALYIQRFASKLQFGEKTHDVSMTATRLVARMKRDWIQFGRRPAGICGAALLIAARLHQFRRSQADIVNVVRVGSATIRKRLDEFEDTPSSKLTTQQFETIYLEGEHDPPSFLQAKKKKRLLEASRAQAEIADREPRLAILPPVTDSITDQAQHDFEAELERPYFLQLDSTTQNTLAPSLASTYLSHTQTSHPASTSHGEVVPVIRRKSKPVAEQIHYDDAASNATLSDLDDGELDVNEYIRTTEEAEQKQKVWERINQPYLQSMEEKRKRDAESGKIKTPSTERKKRRRNQHMETAETTMENVKSMLVTKKVSTKINYAVLEGLNVENVNKA